MSESTHPTGGVFLSYAREDADAARRIAEALRGFGVEVWFDQNELRGGDQWDARIRTQIKTCALFLPIISATTQAREEAYFRLEWKLADDRSQLMAPGKRFIVPVVIDDTPESSAVPESFARAQWTRLEGGVPTSAFIEQVKHLLEGARHKPALKPNLPRPPTLPPELKQARQAKSVAAAPSPAPKKSIPPVALALALGTVAVSAGLVFFVTTRKQPEAAGSAPAGAASSVSPRADDKSVAVLAFANLSGDRANEYFSDGISEELLNVLAKVPGLKVSARTSAFYFKGRQVPVSEIAQQLGVAYIVEGSVQRADDRVKITAQLIKAADGFHLWSEAYTRDIRDIFALQDEIAGKIAASLTNELGVALPATAKTTPEAYTLYLQARATLAKRGVPNLREAARQFEAVIALDPEYLAARSGLAITHALIPAWSRSLTLGENLEMINRAKREARLVIERAPRNAEAWSALGYMLTFYDWRWQEAGEAVRNSLQLAPNDAEIVNFAGDYYRLVLARREAVETEKRAVELNPLQAINHSDLCFCYLALHEYELAVEPARRAISIAPEIIENYDGLIRALGNLKRFEEMRAVIATARRHTPPGSALLANMEILAAVFEGRTADGLRLLEAFRPRVEQDGYSPSEYGYHYLLLGETEQAVRWLKRGIEGRDASLVSPEIVDLEVLAAHPLTRGLLEEPALKELRELRAQNLRKAAAPK